MKSCIKNTFLFLLWITSFPLLAQDRVVTGVVKDVETKQPLAYGSVVILHTSIGTGTDEKGAFTIAIPADISSPKLVIAFMGHTTDTVACLPDQNRYSVFLRLTQNALEEVVVTGVSRATLIRENPVSIVAISPKAIEQSAESNIIEALVKNAPGLSAVSTGPNISKPFIRGLGYNRVLTLYDGVRQEGQQWGDEHGIEVDAYNIYRAEVIKGPASLMFGSDALAGVVSLIPSMPLEMDKKIHGKTFSEYQTNHGLFGQGFRLTYANPHWSYALRGSYRRAKNYSNSKEDRVYNTGFQEINLSSSIQHTTAKGFSTLNFTLYDNLQGIPDGSRDSLTRKFTKQIYEGGADVLANRPLASDHELNSYDLSPLHQHIQHYRIYANNQYAMAKGELDFLLAWQQNIRREYNHPTQAREAGMFVRLNTINYGARYNAPKILNTEISIGVNGMYQHNLNKRATDFPIPDYDLLDVGAYLYAKWKYNRWTASGGIRSDARYLQGYHFYTKTDPATGFERQASFPDTVGAYRQFSAFKKSFDGISMNIGTTFQVSEYVSLKAHVARGYRAPSITELASNGLDPGAHIVYLGNRNFVPEFSFQQDMEIAFHYATVSGSWSLFNNSIEHYIYLSQSTDADGNPTINPQGNKTYQYEQASARLYGTEASLFFHPDWAKGFSIENSFSLIYGSNRKAMYENKGVHGEYLPLIPPLKLVSSLYQNIPIKSNIISMLRLHAEINFNGKQDRFLALSDTETMTPSYTLFNLGVNSTIRYAKKSTCQFQVQVNNVFDKAYQSHLSRLKYFEYYAASSNGNSGMYGMGRNICFKLIIPF